MKIRPQYLKENWLNLFIFAIIVFAAIIRTRSQGDPRLSIANNDTGSYVSASEVRLLSWDAFIGRRLFTTNMVYQLLKPDQGYQILVNGSGDTTKRKIQPGFVGVAVLQFIVSIISWSVLTLSIVRRISNPVTKILMTIIVLAFAFVPQIADWDSVLSSESLSFSLFALQTGLLVELVFRFAGDDKPNSSTIMLSITWLVVVFFWAFLKDAHLFGVFSMGVMIAVSILLRKFKKQGILITALLMLVGFFLWGWITSGRSVRGGAQMVDVYSANILNSPSRVEILETYGMPAPETAEFNSWFAAKSKDAYMKFMLFHPGYVVTGYFRDIPLAFSENIQTYFHTGADYSLHKALIPFGDMLHPLASTPFFVDLILLLGILMNLYNKNTPVNKAWAWLGVWMLLFANIIMFISIFGDTWGLARHALLATTTFRLFMWVFIIVMIDLMISSQKNDVLALKNGQ